MLRSSNDEYEAILTLGLIPAREFERRLKRSRKASAA